MRALALAMLMGALALSHQWVVAESPACDAYGPRIDCGYAGMSPDECQQSGCCWLPAEFPGEPHVDLPWCFRPNAGPSEYKVAGDDVLQGDGGSVQARLAISKRTQPELGADIESLRLDAEPLSDAVLRLKIGDAASQRWEVPQWLLASELLPGASGNSQGKTAAASRAGSGHLGAATSSSASAAVSSIGRLFEWSVKQDPFSLEVTRSQSPAAGMGAAAEAGRSVFNSTGTRLVFKEQYLELSTWLSPDAVLFGAGERASHTLQLVRDGMPRTLWNHDLGPTFPEQNM